jgi:hypothetical protein
MDKDFYQAIIIPLIRRVVPSNIANEICNVQPMQSFGDLIPRILVIERTTKKHGNGIFARIRLEDNVAGGFLLGFTERDALIINEWCKEHKAGNRTAFNEWQFHTEEELTMFVLRWNGVTPPAA